MFFFTLCLLCDQIGSGTALSGVVAAKCGAQVILSDSALFPHCLDNCRKSCHANDLADVKVVPLTWGLLTPTLLQLPAVDFILGSDCFYDTKGVKACKVLHLFTLERMNWVHFISVREKLLQYIYCYYQHNLGHHLF